MISTICIHNNCPKMMCIKGERFNQLCYLLGSEDTDKDTLLNTFEVGIAPSMGINSFRYAKMFRRGVLYAEIFIDKPAVFYFKQRPTSDVVDWVEDFVDYFRALRVDASELESHNIFVVWLKGDDVEMNTKWDSRNIMR